MHCTILLSLVRGEIAREQVQFYPCLNVNYRYNRQDHNIAAGKPIKKALPVWRTIELNTFCLYTFAVVVFPGFLSWSRRGSEKTGDGKTKRKKTILFGQVSLETERYLKNRSHLHWAIH